MITIHNFTGKPYKRYESNNVNMYRIPITEGEDRQELHREIRNVLGNALYRLEDHDLGYVQVMVHCRKVDEKINPKKNLLLFEEFNHAQSPAEVTPEQLGKTESGKDVYDKVDHPAHKDFTKQDHIDASLIHSRIVDKAKTVKARERASYKHTPLIIAHLERSKKCK